MGVSRYFLILFVAAIISMQWLDLSIFSGNPFQKYILQPQKAQIYPPLNCSDTCPPKFYAKSNLGTSSQTCPDYFRWIYEDLRPWKKTGITKEMVDRGKDHAHIRLVIVNGTVYMEKFDRPVFQTRDVFTVWGILQLLRLYPGQLPDVDLMIECGDKPKFLKEDYDKQNVVPPVFHYCGDDSSYDIVFPDWSYWGWPELKIKPWEVIKKDLEEANNVTKWENREPYAYWKGNAKLGRRPELVKCNLSEEHDWNARIYAIDWQKERRAEGFKNSDLTDQCTHKYKIYVEGNAWSVSEKYILACDSVTLIINTHFYDFFTRSLVPTVHYWPINENQECRSIKFAVDWGNHHPEKAKEIGEQGSRFVQTEVQMKYVITGLLRGRDEEEAQITVTGEESFSHWSLQHA
nr:PREDICTED: O-glucosyltransferase rumi homolog isoform X2 [Daucus carota subsp. sativus]